MDTYASGFFQLLEGTPEPFGRGECFECLESAILNFLGLESSENAFAVYSAFFDIYQVTDRSRKTAFLGLVDIIKMYEENAAGLTDSQRDHFIHSVNVFVLGLSVYARNPAYRTAFAGSAGSSVFGSDHERFLYSWGFTALIHDVGYPVEIACNQVNRFVRIVSGIDHRDPGIKGSFVFRNFDELRYLDRGSWSVSEDGIRTEMGYPADTDVFDIYSLLSHSVSRMIGLDTSEVFDVISGFPEKMASASFVDHSFYSTLILMKWVGHIYQMCGFPPEPFFPCICDVGASILLHNFYRWTFTKPPFNLPPLCLDKAPLAFMIILCDELQEWNRRSYGFKTPAALPENSTIYITEERMHVDYRTSEGRIADSFAAEKEELLSRLLDVGALFPGGVDVMCTCERSADVLLEEIERENAVNPVPLYDNIRKLAMEIHRQYNEERAREFPDRCLEYPTWTSLPQDLRYSNLTQARDIPHKLSLIGCSMVPADDPRPAVTEFSEDEEKRMGVREHDRWVNERMSNGWVYGPVKDVENRRSPYIAPWEDIPDPIKEYDLQAVRKIPILVSSIGMKVVRGVRCPIGSIPGMSASR